jgi:hypothetical protein
VIAAVLGITRNAVLGKVHRTKMAALPRLRANQKAKAARNRKPPMVFAKMNPAPALPSPEPEPVCLMDLQAHHCRWPVAGAGADTLFCGATTISSRCSYCQKHYGLGFVAPPARKPRPFLWQPLS